MESYKDFINSKKHLQSFGGIEIKEESKNLFDYQSFILNKAANMGRCAVFLDTGLGKTAIELNIANNYLTSTNKSVLILTPLSVAFQFIKEAEKFGIDNVTYCKDGKFTKGIIVTNYERLHYFNANDFDCVILDESSILKNFEGAYRELITLFMKKIKYRYLFTATPSPNDFIELGTSSEALGYLGYTDVLNKYFSNKENTIKSMDRIGAKFYLKPHAKDAFFDFIRSWSITARKPSDLGFSDNLHILPKLITKKHQVFNDSNWVINGQMLMFAHTAKNSSEIRQESRMTITKRCEKAVELTKNKEYSVYWCNLNDEGDIIEELDKDSVQIFGSMDMDKKEDILQNFSNGSIKKLITKAKMTAFGLNWQHCNHTVYFPTFSYEQYYQAIRRFWRFGQKNEVNVDLVFSDGQNRIIDSLFKKTEKANELFSELTSSVNKQELDIKNEYNKPINLPKFI